MFNTLGPTLFDDYNTLAPQRAETGETALEVLDLPKGRKDTTAECIANRVADILKAETPVYDKALKTMRPARPSDVAVLTYTHKKASAAAAALEAQGLPVRIQQDGWLTSPAMRAATSGKKAFSRRLSVINDPPSFTNVSTSHGLLLAHFCGPHAYGTSFGQRLPHTVRPRPHPCR